MYIARSALLSIRNSAGSSQVTYYCPTWPLDLLTWPFHLSSLGPEYRQLDEGWLREVGFILCGGINSLWTCSFNLFSLPIRLWSQAITVTISILMFNSHLCSETDHRLTVINYLSLHEIDMRPSRWVNLGIIRNFRNLIEMKITMDLSLHLSCPHCIPWSFQSINSY